MALGMNPWICITQSVDIGQDDEEVGLDEVGDQGREVVIVPELDLIHHHRIVLIDDGNDPELKKGQQGIAGIQEPLPVAQVIAGEENLGDHLLMA